MAICTPYFVIPAQAGTHDKLQHALCVNCDNILQLLAKLGLRIGHDVGPGLRRDDVSFDFWRTRIVMHLPLRTS